jgi:hypothetical protein
VNAAALHETDLDSPGFLKRLAEAWPVLTSLAVAFITIGILWNRVDAQGEKIRDQQAEQKKMSETLNETARDVAVIRAILEERLPKGQSR